MVERAARALLRQSVDEMIDCGDGIRLLAHHTPPVSGGSPRLAVLIHGWEGSANSLYILSTATRLWCEGFRLVRLNLRDHGPSHHLNRELFHSCRLAEVVGAMKWIQERFPDEQIFLGGFSLGGNFALRIAAQAPAAGLRLARVAAICPVLDPEETMDALEYGWPGYRAYFMRKWRRSLHKKREAFPDEYDFTSLEQFRSIKKMTAYFVTHFTEFPDLETYLRGYAVTGDRLAGIEAPTSVLLADDDPVIPVTALSRVARPPPLTVQRSSFGGHCGFIAGYRLRSWLDDYIVAAMRLSPGNRSRGS
jgi:predicted alpha/beta-fold hydrolase